jgi:hypothetical protein
MVLTDHVSNTVPLDTIYPSGLFRGVIVSVALDVPLILSVNKLVESPLLIASFGVVNLRRILSLFLILKVVALSKGLTIPDPGL